MVPSPPIRVGSDHMAGFMTEVRLPTPIDDRSRMSAVTSRSALPTASSGRFTNSSCTSLHDCWYRFLAAAGSGRMSRSHDGSRGHRGRVPPLACCRRPRRSGRTRGPKRPRSRRRRRLGTVLPGAELALAPAPRDSAETAVVECRANPSTPRRCPAAVDRIGRSPSGTPKPPAAGTDARIARGRTGRDALPRFGAGRLGSRPSRPPTKGCAHVTSTQLTPPAGRRNQQAPG